MAYKCKLVNSCMNTTILSVSFAGVLVCDHKICPLNYFYPHSLFAGFRHLRGEPRSRAQIYAHCGAYAVRRSLNCALISLNAIGTGELKQ